MRNFSHVVPSRFTASFTEVGCYDPDGSNLEFFENERNMGIKALLICFDVEDPLKCTTSEREAIAKFLLWHSLTCDKRTVRFTPVQLDWDFGDDEDISNDLTKIEHSKEDKIRFQSSVYVYTNLNTGITVCFLPDFTVGEFRLTPDIWDVTDELIMQKNRTMKL